MSAFVCTSQSLPPLKPFDAKRQTHVFDMQQISVDEVPDVVPVVRGLVLLDYFQDHANDVSVVVDHVAVHVGVRVREDLGQDGHEPREVGFRGAAGGEKAVRFTRL